MMVALPGCNAIVQFVWGHYVDGKCYEEAYQSVYVGNIFERFCLDYVGPFPETQSKNRYILLVVECSTRYPLTITCQRDDAVTAASFFDNGTHFVNLIVDNFLRIIKNRHKRPLPYRPNVNGMAEKIIGVLVKSVKKTIYRISGNWDDYLNSILSAYRTKTHSALRLSPFELLYGALVNPMDNDIIDKIATAYGFERLVKIIDLREHAYFSSIEGSTEISDNRYHVGPATIEESWTPYTKIKFTSLLRPTKTIYRLFGIMAQNFDCTLPQDSSTCGVMIGRSAFETLY
ncbi:hypothetical protein [Absidia glauca]|uniref:Integrase catalytic domain-containing protein n=1 Tax=Absidia glauca TaxID=4829 RepID=A0A163J4K8_ABSGL|nr:hypothetical protein [Absidia glauca]